MGVISTLRKRLLLHTFDTLLLIYTLTSVILTRWLWFQHSKCDLKPHELHTQQCNFDTLCDVDMLNSTLKKVISTRWVWFIHAKCDFNSHESGLNSDFFFFLWFLLLISTLISVISQASFNFDTMVVISTRYLSFPYMK
jgi:hypothetical protein